MMSAGEESLAGELSISGGEAWGKLQNDITSQLKWPIENAEGELVDTPLTAIINLRSHEDEAMRRRGYEAELGRLEDRRSSPGRCPERYQG